MEGQVVCCALRAAGCLPAGKRCMLLPHSPALSSNQQNGNHAFSSPEEHVAGLPSLCSHAFTIQSGMRRSAQEEGVGYQAESWGGRWAAGREVGWALGSRQRGGAGVGQQAESWGGRWASIRHIWRTGVQRRVGLQPTGKTKGGKDPFGGRSWGEGGVALANQPAKGSCLAIRMHCKGLAWFRHLRGQHQACGTNQKWHSNMEAASARTGAARLPPPSVVRCGHQNAPALQTA